MNRGNLSNEQWEGLQPLLPPQKPRTGKANNDHSTVINGILRILKTGVPWRDFPERYGKWKSVAKASNDHSTVINGILRILKTGVPWRDFPERYGKWESLVSGKMVLSVAKIPDLKANLRKSASKGR